MYDVLIIGAGVVGCSIARELSRYHLKIGVLEKEEDVGAGTSKANSGIAHAGFDAVPGSLKAKLNLEGNLSMDHLSKELDFPFRRNGSIVLCFQEEDIPKLEKLKQTGIQNGVAGLEILRGDAMRAIEPNISDQVVALLHAPSGGIVCPFSLTLAMAENAAANGVEFYFEEEVEELIKTDEYFEVRTKRGVYKSKRIVNAAGLYGDVLHNMLSKQKRSITARKGEYLLLDKKAGDYVQKTVFQLPSEMGKGVLITPTIHGNLLVGPTAVDIEEKEDTKSTKEGILTVIEKSKMSAKDVPLHQVITSFAGLRAHEAGDDFVIGEVSDVPGFFEAVGIESPGLTSAPAIGATLARMVANSCMASRKQDFIAKRKAITRVDTLDKEELAALIQKNPAYGSIVCRCEMITEGEIIEAIQRPLGAKSLDGLKRRVRTGAGRCQAGFCTPKTIEILARELGKSVYEITKSGKGSELLMKERLEEKQ